MLVTFTCKAYADITMFGDVAQKLLKIMGYSNPQQGAILADEVPVVLARLQQGIKSNASSTPQPMNKDEHEPPVSLAHRALPLIELLSAAAKEKCDVLWKAK